MSVFGMTPEQYQASVIAAQARFAERHEQRRNSEATPAAAWDRLGIHEWIKLMRDLGYWDNPEEPIERFWERVSSWASQSEVQSAASSPQSLSASPPSRSAPVSGSSSPEVPPLGVDPEMA